ncbi:MAG: hypothetical protein H6942_10985 [Candidatus Accumulibacter sp.]|uniref:hypothetical protein n=1 Tax=Accumulibacter sp. TaxID=2053492 RepID=UPI001D767375|nr:hypothetical protein [Accumulibacter sp.]MCB1941741.1 hypothetical protein [Accumulibacter sp.]MCP5249039.1 hypothetical protein [Accumulibacter sp.]
MIVGRRQFIKTGLAGSVLLSFAGWLNAAGSRQLSDAEREMLAAVVNAMLAGVLPTESRERRRLVTLTVNGVATAVSGLSAATQKEIGELFGLLVIAPARLVLAGVGKPWREASVGEVSEFLQAWRSSRLNLLQSAYGALHDLTFGAWYGRPGSWQAISYPGPPRGYF